MTLALPIILAVSESEPAGPSNVGLGAVVLTVAVAAFLAWMGYLLVASWTRRAKPEETPKNLQPYLSDDELEVNRITRVLGAAVVAAAVLAIVLPVYYVNESNRQAKAAEAIHEKDIEEGERWWEKFVCTECHGPVGAGGGAPFVEKRSGIDVAWAAPSLNDVYFRYSEEEIRQVIVNGRAGTPMAPAGLEGGGAMTSQEIDQVIAFIENFQITQGETLSKIEDTVGQALGRIVGGDAAVARLLLEQQARTDDVLDAPSKLENQARFLADSGAFATETAANPQLKLNEAVRLLISRDGACTDESAALAGTTCGIEGVDRDRDGIADEAEDVLTGIAAEAFATITTRTVSPQGETVATPSDFYDISFDASSAFTNSDVTGTAIADLDELETFLGHLDSDILTLTVITERQDRFLETVDLGTRFLEDAAAAQRWIPDGVTVTSAEAEDGTTATTADYSGLATRMAVNAAQAERAVGLFNGYCARCHTAGYSAGVAFEQGAGSGAWGPALRDGRSVVQFPVEEDQISFIIRGSEFGASYGVNGLGSGRMPGFGQVLSLEDIELIVAYERTL